MSFNWPSSYTVSAKIFAQHSPAKFQTRKSSPSTRKTGQKGAFAARWANFFAELTRIPPRWANFFAVLAPKEQHMTLLA